MVGIRSIFGFLWDTAKVIVVALLIIVPIRMFVFQPFFVRGASMEPNFRNGDYLIIDEGSYRFRDPERGEVVVFRYPQDPSQFYIKRIVGLPGETVSIKSGRVSVRTNASVEEELKEAYLGEGTVTSGDTVVTLGPDEYFVLGDNRDHSSDSRRWGAFDRNAIVGRVLVLVWPLENFTVFAAPEY